MHVYVLVETVSLSDAPHQQPYHQGSVCEGGIWPSGKGVTDDAGTHEKEKGENRWLPFAHCIFY